MPGPWDDYAPAGKVSGPWTDYAPQDAITPDTPAPAKAYSGDYLPMQPWSSSLLPVSSDTEGRISFDPNAGILGGFKNAAISAYKFARGPGDALSGIPAPSTDEAIPGAAAIAGILSQPSAGAVSAMSRAAIEAKTAVPTAAETGAVSNAQYGALRGMGVDYASQPVADLIGTHQRDLVKDGLRDNVAPLTHGVLDDLQKVPANQSSVMELGALESARQNLVKISRKFKGDPEGEAARRSIGAITDFMANPPAGSVVSGPAEQAAKMVADARGNWAVKKQSENLTDLSDYATLQNLSRNSGNNLENIVRQKVTSLFDPKYPQRLSGYTPDEVAELRQIVAGGPVKNAMRWAGNLLGGGGGLGNIAAQTAGSFLGGTPGVVAAATTGPLLKYLGGRGTVNKLNSIDEMVRMRSPLYAERLAGADQNPALLPNMSSAPTIGLLTAQPQPGPNDGILSRIWENPIGFRIR